MLDMEFLSPSTPHTSESLFQSLSDPVSLRLPSFYYMLPSLGISLGGQFFVFFQVLLIGCCDSGQNLWESANKSFPINVRCSLPTPVTTQTVSKKAIESSQGEILSKSTFLDLSWQKVLYIFSYPEQLNR